MPITLTITADTLGEALAALGNVPIGVYHAQPEVDVGSLVTSAVGVAAAEDIERPAKPAAVAEAEAAKPRRGRPPKDAAPAAAQGPAPVFTVRRYDGKVEGEYADSGQAAEVLIGLIREARDREALDALHAANFDDVQKWPTERQADIDDASKAAYSTVEQEAKQPEERGGAPAKAHFALDGSPLTAITPDKQGAMNGVNAVAAAEGGRGGPGFQAAAAFLQSIGVTTPISQRPDNDPKLKQIAEWAAARLGLPIAGATTGALV